MKTVKNGLYRLKQHFRKRVGIRDFSPGALVNQGLRGFFAPKA
nr:MAG TPA: BLOC-1-related complex sub-unit 8 [Caudoviricetes sp.]